MKPLLVGVAPVPGTPGDQRGIAFVGTASGRNLAKIVGVEDSWALQECFDMVNLYRQPNPEWNRAEANRRARALEVMLVIPRGYERVVLFSSPVARAFGFDYHPHFTWREREYHVGGREHCVSYAVSPHPTGLVRFWNQAENRQAANEFFAQLLLDQAMPR